MAEPSYTVTLTWTLYPHPELVTSLTVKRDGTLIATLTATDTTFVDDGTTIAGAVIGNTTYQYEVDVNFDNMCPTRAALVDVDVGCYEPPVTLLAAFGGDAGNIYASWTVDEAPKSHFTLYWGTTPGGPYLSSVDIDPSQLSYQITGLANGTYYLVVRAFDFETVCGSSPSNEASAEVTGSVTPPPPAPSITGNYVPHTVGPDELDSVNVVSAVPGLNVGGTYQLWGNNSGLLDDRPNNTANPVFANSSAWSIEDFVWVIETGNGIDYVGPSSPSNTVDTIVGGIGGEGGGTIGGEGGDTVGGE